MVAASDRLFPLNIIFRARQTHVQYIKEPAFYPPISASGVTTCLHCHLVVPIKLQVVFPPIARTLVFSADVDL